MAKAEPQRTLGRYVLDEPIATGTTATIWRGHDARTGRVVAVKYFHQHLLADRSARRRMENEARAAQSVRAPTIVSAIDRISRRDEFALVFPFVTGTTLAERLKEPSPLPAEEAAAIGADVADALAAIHRHSLVHRDVKPANILLRGDGRAVLLDFGISRAVTDDIELDQALTGAGLAIGTLPYMAPEQLSARQLSPQTDVYALGVVLYEMLAGSRPYEANTPVSLSAEQRLLPPRVADAPPPLVDLAIRAVAFSATARPTAAEFAASLRSWLAAPYAADAPTAQVAAVPQSSAAPLAPGAAAPPRPATSHRPIWTTAALALAAILLVGLVAFAALPASAPAGAGPTEAPVAAALEPTAPPSPTAETPTPIPVVPAIAPASPPSTPPASPTPPPESRSPKDPGTPKHHHHHHHKHGHHHKRHH